MNKSSALLPEAERYVVMAVTSNFFHAPLPARKRRRLFAWYYLFIIPPLRHRFHSPQRKTSRRGGAGCEVDGLWVAEFAWGVALADEAFAGALVWDGVGHAVDGGTGWAVE